MKFSLCRYDYEPGFKRFVVAMIGNLIAGVCAISLCGLFVAFIWGACAYWWDIMTVYL